LCGSLGIPSTDSLTVGMDPRREGKIAKNTGTIGRIFQILLAGLPLILLEQDVSVRQVRLP
jgi:hypothetical protein